MPVAYPSLTYYGDTMSDLQAIAEKKPGESDIEYYSRVVETVAPAVQSLLAGLPAREQEKILEAKIRNLQQYVKMPVLGPLILAQIEQYRARLVAVREMAAEERRRAEKITSLITIAQIFGVGLVALVLSGVLYNVTRAVGE
jgi:hypothetical protein